MSPKHPTYITKNGHDALLAELKHLQLEERPRVVQEVADAAAQGDRSENAEYIYGKKRLREIDRRTRYLMRVLKHAKVVDPRQQSGDTVYFGATVVVENEDESEQTLQIVGPDEIDPSAGKISMRSPIGAALLGKTLDDEISVETPRGKRTLWVVEVRYE